ncbi:hypothetical protein DXA01_24410 [Bacteroides caccae]|nr:hypothetical protein DXA01_24410 [Bacteroides caccae]
MKIPIANKDSLVKKYFFIYAFVVRTIIRYGHNKQIPQDVKKKRGLPYQHSEVFGVTRIDDKFHPRIAQAFTELIRVYTSSNRQIFRVYRIIVNAINYMFMLYL